MRRFSPWVVLALVLSPALAPGALRAWGDEGHRIVGDVAWRHLTPAAQRAAAELLAGDDRTLAYAATWADRLRDDPAWDWAKPYHYINAPDGEASLDLARDCPPRGCVVRGIEENLAVLSDPAGPRQRRLEALKFLAHFVGDVHQPLHAGYASDRGGNEIDVTFFGRPANLHRVWDSLILERRLGWFSNWSRRRLARRLAASVTAEERARWAAGTPLGWAQESLTLARSHAYAARPGDVLGEAYYERNLPLVEERLRQAGVRLAWLLDRALGGG